MRRCGPCRECCIVMSIEEIDKPHDTACPHLCSKGCGIYDKRPGECAKFNCMWRLKLMPAWMKPHKVHAVGWPGKIMADGQPMPVVRINFNAAFPRNKRVLRWAKVMSRRYLVVMSRGDKFEAILNGETRDCGRHGDSWEFDIEDGRITDIRLVA